MSTLRHRARHLELDDRSLPRRRSDRRAWHRTAARPPRSSERPRWPSSARRSRSSAEKPWPSSETTSRASPERPLTVDAHASRLRVVDDVAERLLRDPIDERLLRLVDDAPSRRPTTRRATPRASSGLTRSRIAASRPAAARWGDGDRRAGRGDRGRCGGGCRSPPRGRARPPPLPARAALIGERRERVRDAGDVLHRPVVEIGGDPAPLAVRGGDRIREQRLSFLVAPLEAADQRPDERHLHEHEERDRAEDRRRQLGEEPARTGVDRVEPLVDLEQDRGSGRGPDRGVRLDQLAPDRGRGRSPADRARSPRLPRRPRAGVAAARRRARTRRRSASDRRSRARGRPATRS